MPAQTSNRTHFEHELKAVNLAQSTGTGRQWLASMETGRLYSYEFEDNTTDSLNPLFMNSIPTRSISAESLLERAAVGPILHTSRLMRPTVLSLKDLEVERQTVPEVSLDRVESPAVFRPTIDKPSQLSSSGLDELSELSEATWQRCFSLGCRAATKVCGALRLLIMAFVGMPLALSFGRKGTIIALCAAVGVSIAYWGVGGGFQQLGNHGLLRPSVAGWSPLLIFAAAGTYFLSRVRT